MAPLVAKRYATALFELAVEKDNIDLCLENLVYLNKFLDEEDFLVTLKHPQLEASEKISILEGCLKEDAPSEITGLINLIVNKGRAGILPALVDEFKVMSEQHKSLMQAHIFSAVNLSQEQLGKIKATLENKYKKSFKIEEHIDPSVIGGIKVRVGDDVVDVSIKKDIEDIRNSLLNL